MDTRIAREIVRVIRGERERRRSLLKEADNDYAYDQWRFEDVPFINELCLTLLVALWHQIEREFVHRAARVSVDGQPISADEYLQNVGRMRKLLRRHSLTHLAAKLNVTIPDWMETLRLLANCYKHDPTLRPSDALLNHLKLPLVPTKPLVVAYAPLSESALFLSGLAASIGVNKDGDLCAVAEELIDRIEEFMTNLEHQSSLSPVQWGPVSLSEFEG